MAYTFQTFTVGQVFTAAQANQIEVNVRDHQHGMDGVSGVHGSVTFLGSGLAVGSVAPLGLGTVNAKAGVYDDGVRLGVVTTVSSFVGGNKVYCYGEHPSLPVTFNIFGNIGSAWETVGPTGSGATNIWTALDAVPSSAVAIIMKIYSQVSGTTASDIVSQDVYAQKYGASSATTFQTLVSINAIQVNAAGDDNLSIIIDEFVLPVDQARLELRMVISGTSNGGNCTALLTGFIVP